MSDLERVKNNLYKILVSRIDDYFRKLNLDQEENQPDTFYTMELRAKKYEREKQDDIKHHFFRDEIDDYLLVSYFDEELKFVKNLCDDTRKNLLLKIQKWKTT